MKLVDETKSLLQACLEEAGKHVTAGAHHDRLKKFLLQEVSKVADAAFVDVKTKVEDFIRRHERPYTQHHNVIEKKKMLEYQRGSNSLPRKFQEMTGQAIAAIQDSIKFKTENQDIAMAAEIEDFLDSYGDSNIYGGDSSYLYRCIALLSKKDLLSIRDDDIQKIMRESNAFLKEYQALQDETKELGGSLEIFQNVM